MNITTSEKTNTPTASSHIAHNVDGADTGTSSQSINNKKRSFDESVSSFASSTRGDETSLSKDAQQEGISTTRSSSTAKGDDDRDERRMEINRIRAKEIRKRKKKMEEDMQKQIIQLTLENNKLRTQLKMQQTEISLLRSKNNQLDLSTFAAQNQQQQFFVPDYRESLLRSQHGLLQPNGPNGAIIYGTGGLLDQQNGNQNLFNAAAVAAAGGVPVPGLNSLGLLPQVQQQVIGGQVLNSITPPTQDGSASLASLAAAGINSFPVDNDLSGLFGTAGGIPSSQNQPLTNDMGIGIEGSGGNDANEQHLATLLANSTSNVKHSILVKLQNEEKEARKNENFLSEKLLDPSVIAGEV